MSILKKLFGGGSGGATGPAPTEYNGYAITPAPMKEGPAWRIAATIEKDGKTHRLIRADTINDHATAIQASLDKAKMLIDQQGDRLFL